ncbi:hypothetical protein HJC23_008000 [Cyclotella cryptica]|uniref:Uncharacterized protein n=1 Tax=Cyclotella cryptica TaxID=29204 RepID=A0ABD3P6U5_9STRA
MENLKKNKVLWKVFSPKEALLNDLMFQGLMLIQVAYSQAHYQLVANPILLRSHQVWLGGL